MSQPHEDELLPQISDAEWTIMKVLWHKAEATANDVIQALKSQTSWKPRTIQTLLSRLVQKGAVTYEKQGREYTYRPLIDDTDSRYAASRSFLHRVFDGRVAPFLATLVEREDLSPEEIEELKRILEEGTSK